jgi:phosphoglycerol transferase MdoB-like AlkP superfamily enzyme
MLTLFSLDTHMPVYHKDAKCQQNFGDIRDAFICSDGIVYDFINWLKTSPYWQNTTVIVIGDHLFSNEFNLRKKQFLISKLSKSDRLKKRSIYNLFLNLPEDKKISDIHKFSTLDLAPTILESLDIKISPRAFGLGRSLFAPEPTLSDKMGPQLSSKLIQKSKVYKKFCTPPQRIEHYHTYTLNTTLNNEDMLPYTDAHQKLFNTYYIDHLNLLLDKTPTKDLHVSLKFNAFIQKGIPLPSPPIIAKYLP